MKRSILAVIGAAMLSACGQGGGTAQASLEAPANWRAAQPPAWAAAASTEAPELVIAEVNLTEKPVWVELYCLRGPVDLASYTLTDLDGEDPPLVSEPLTLKEGEYVVVRFAEGRNETDRAGDANGNGIREVYISGRRQSPSQNLDQLVLKSDNGALVDAFAWAMPGQAPERWEIEDMSALQLEEVWRGACAERTEAADAGTTLAGAAFVRTSLARDNASAENWKVAYVSTPGQATEMADLPEKGAVVITEVAPLGSDRMGVSNYGPFAELTCVKGPVNLQHFSLHNMDGAQRRLADVPVTLKTGERLVVRWGVEGTSEADGIGDRNRNGIREIFLGKNAAPASTADQLVLSLRGEVFDAVVWEADVKTASAATSSRPNNFERDNRVLSERNAWNGTALRLPDRDALLVRNEDGNWLVGTVPTPGRENRYSEPLPREAVVITEVFPGASGVKGWAECMVTEKAGEAADVSFIVATDLDGVAEPLAAEPITLRPGERFVIHWNDRLDVEDEVDRIGDANGNGVRDLYLSGSGPSRKGDQLALLLGGNVIDAVAWNEDPATVAESEKADLAFIREKLGREAASRIVTEKLEGEPGPSLPSLARAGAGTGAWGLSFDPTPGLANDVYATRSLGNVRIAAFQFKRADDNTSDWVELIAVSGTSDISRVTLSDLDGIDAPLSLEPITLRPGEKARVYWRRGVTETDRIGDANGNGIREIYIADERPTRTTDQIALFHNGKMKDAVVFAEDVTAMLTYDELKDVQRIIAAGLWEDRLDGRVINNAVPNVGAAVERAAAPTRTSTGWVGM